jgi:hypothetical protein
MSVNISCSWIFSIFFVIWSFHDRKNSLTSEEQDTPEDDSSGENKTDKIDIVNSIQLIEHKLCELSNCLDKHLDFITKKIEQIERQDGLWDQKTLEISSGVSCSSEVKLFFLSCCCGFTDACFIVSLTLFSFGG